MREKFIFSKDKKDQLEPLTAESQIKLLSAGLEEVLKPSENSPIEIMKDWRFNQ